MWRKEEEEEHGSDHMWCRWQQGRTSMETSMEERK
jgi:hypothetical protein